VAADTEGASSAGVDRATTGEGFNRYWFEFFVRQNLIGISTCMRQSFTSRSLSLLYVRAPKASRCRRPSSTSTGINAEMSQPFQAGSSGRTADFESRDVPATAIRLKAESPAEKVPLARDVAAGKAVRARGGDTGEEQRGLGNAVSDNHASLAQSVEAISAGQLQHREHFEHLLRRRDIVAPIYNSLINSFSKDAVMAQVQGRHAPLNGAVIVVKDCVEYEGCVTTGGLSSDLMPHFISQQDAPVVQALREAGAVCLGKANLPDLHMGLSTVKSSFGIVKHPMAPDRPVVGSSGGVACSVLLGFCNGGIGVDTGGCLSIPSSLTGLCGFRCSADSARYSTLGIFNQSCTRDQPGPIARTVEDIQFLDHYLKRSLAIEKERKQQRAKGDAGGGGDEHKGAVSAVGAAIGSAAKAVGSGVKQAVNVVTAGHSHIHDDHGGSVKPATRASFKKAELAGLRIAVPRKHYYEGLDPQVAGLMERSLDRLKTAGVVLVEGSFLEGYEPWEVDKHVGSTIRSFEILREVSRWYYQHEMHQEGGEGREQQRKSASGAGSGSAAGIASSGSGWRGVRHLVENFPGSPLDKAMMLKELDLSTATTSTEYRAALAVHRPVLQQAFADYFLRHDVQAMIYPATPMSARKITAEGKVELNASLVPAYSTYTRNTAPSSNAGVPVVAFPVGLAEERKEDGSAVHLPVGMQCCGPYGTDDRLLEIARALQEFFEPAVKPAIDDLHRRLAIGEGGAAELNQ
jgi:Asp-tRNA(Asn)/Glu-tRNA(Gln) amidotransferase A subunit family amidase